MNAHPSDVVLSTALDHPSTDQRLATHLSRCDRCSTTMKHMDYVRNKALALRVPVPPPEVVWSRIEPLLESRQAPWSFSSSEPRASRWRYVILRIAIVAALMMAAYKVVRPRLASADPAANGTTSREGANDGKSSAMQISPIAPIRKIP